jgi:hypothetical protein
VFNTTGGSNTAVGYAALFNNTVSNANSAIGLGALESNTTGSNNTAVGTSALFGSTTGNNNIAIGSNAGLNLTSGSNNIYLGTSSSANESNTMRLGQGQNRTFIAGVAGTALSGSQVLVSSTGQLGILTSSARYKRDISAMGARSRGLFELRPVTFRYKHDPERTQQYGLICRGGGQGLSGAGDAAKRRDGRVGAIPRANRDAAQRAAASAASAAAAAG